jgi:hypothetical protein
MPRMPPRTMAIQPQLGITLWIVWTSRCSGNRRVHPRHPLSRRGASIWPAPPWNLPVPPGVPQAGLALSDRRPAGAAAGPVRGRMTGIRSCWAPWRPGWSPIAAGMIGSQPVWCSRGGRSWSAATWRSTPSRCLCTRGSCWSGPARPRGQPSCGCCSVSSSPGSPPAPAQAWSPGSESRAQRPPPGCAAPATFAAAVPATPTVNLRARSPVPACRALVSCVSRPGAS